MEYILNRTCPSENKEADDPSTFWDHGLHLDAHRMGWAISGVCALIATIVSLYLIIRHSQFYHRPEYQRHIIRIVLMVPIYSVVSWLSYRFFHYGTYFEAIRDCYEAFVIAAFFALLTQYVDNSPDEKKEILENTAKKKCSFPLCCYKYKPTSYRFLNLAKWGILQYVVLIPLVTFATLITQAAGVYCAESMSFVFAKVYLKILQLVGVTVAMYALITFYAAISETISSEKPFLKILCVKLVIFFSFWQAVTLAIFAHLGLIHETQYWTQANISRGINALLICFEMAIFSFLHVYAFSYKQFRDFGGNVKTPTFKGIMDALNPIDILREIVIVTKIVWDIFTAHAKAKMSKSPKKDDFNIHRAVTLKRKQKYKNLETDTQASA